MEPIANSETKKEQLPAVGMAALGAVMDLHSGRQTPMGQADSDEGATDANRKHEHGGIVLDHDAATVIPIFAGCQMERVGG